MSVKLNEGEKKELAWWCRHHKENVAYLCQRFEQIIAAMDAGNEEKVEMYKSMMKAQLPAFIESATR
jgi:hypothetical protein|tara:strand:+ start:8947 stop:9147 length:201 start_codon:yes stop_codon:yes gene_type:complete